MSFVLRIGLIVVSLLTLIFITRKVRNAQVRLEDSLFCIFPQIFFGLAKFAGIESPANLVFLLFIFILLILGFSLSVHLSQTDTKLKELTQQLAVEKFERYCHDQENKKENESDQMDLF